MRSGPGRQLLREVRAAAKTAVAVHWAHRVKDRFSGGQLFVNLRGYSPGDPVSAADALEAMLRSLNVAPERIPAGTDARSVLLRSELACRKILLLLDNVRDSDQVRCLIPGGDALVLVTSRAKLREPAARDGARHKTLGVLPPVDAIELLSRAIGPGRVAAEPPQPRWPGFRCPEPRRPWPSSPTPACSNGSPPATTSSTACSTSTPASRARNTTPTRTPPSADSSCGMCTPRRPPARGRAAAPSPTYASRDVPASGVAPPWSSPVTKGTANPAVRLGTKRGRGRQLTAVGTHDEASAVGREARDLGPACRPLDRRPRPAAGRPPSRTPGSPRAARPRVDE
ncbi:SARP family transcriptional regulator [Streptomyces sparsogenes DSM 40356]|uniref:SARP family transcriptional regulator n=1 Tax=Streptomyces sparsogenes DSM 40356 TaxID=1331668 RepID=A0A1R1SF83_9ACTN|nr:SARP family transcriptional regulator [Streptomyces sparsogenes DSM 40356]